MSYTLKYLVLLSFLITFVSNKTLGQELLVSIPHKLEGLAFNISKSDIITDEQSGLKFLFLSSDNYVTLYCINDNQEVVYKQATKIPGFNAYHIIGSQFKEQTLTILLHSGTNYYLESFNLETQKHTETPIKIKTKGENSLRAIPNDNQIKFISYHKKNNHFILRTLNDDLTFSKQIIPFNYCNFKSFYKFSGALNTTTTIHPNWNYHPKRSTSSLQFSYSDSYVNYLFKNEDSLRNVRIDLNDLTVNYYSELSTLPDGFMKSNHIVYKNQLFSLYSHSSAIKLQVKDLQTKNVLDNKTFTDTNTFTDWFSKPNTSEFPVNQLNNKTQEQQFIKRVNKFKPILSVSNYNSDYVIRIGGLRKEYQHNPYGGRTPVYKEEYVQEMWLDENYTIKDTQMNIRAIEQVLNYRIPINKPQGITLFKYKNTYIIGYYNASTERYVLKEFKD